MLKIMYENYYYIKKLCYLNLMSHIKGRIVYVYFEINNKIMLFLTISSLHHSAYVQNKIKLKQLLNSFPFD